MLPRRPVLALACALLATAGPVAAEEPTVAAAEETRFILRVRGREAGFGWFRAEPAADGAVRFEGETLLKLLQNGQETVVRSKRVTLARPEDRFPREYRATTWRDEQSSTYECRLDGDRLLLTATVRGAPASASFSTAAIGALIDYNAPEHFEIFLRGRLKTPGPFQTAAVVTEMMSALPLVGRVGAEEEIEVDGEPVRAVRVEFHALGMLYRLWLDGAGRLARIEVPSQSFVGVRTRRSREEFSLEAADLMRSFSVPLRRAPGVRDPAGAVRRVGAVTEARFRVRVKVGENRTDAEALDNPHQRFDPADPAEPGWVTGVLTVTPQSIGARGGARAGPDDLVRWAEFLRPEDGIEADAAEVRARADQLAPPDAPPLAVVKAATDWVHAWMTYETQLVSALAALQGRVGDCLTWSRLTIALLRARGIPARTIGGIALGGGGRRLGQHHWVEAWGGPEVGWIQLDPTYGQSSGIDAFHLDLWRQGTFDGSAENEVVLEAWTGDGSEGPEAD